MASLRNTFGLTSNAETGWSSSTRLPNMTTLLGEHRSELWAATAIPYSVHYHTNGVVVQPDESALAWKKRGFLSDMPSPEATRFKGPPRG
ncbi:hypothetical protein DUNSADRAFT_2288 [Dunaliella salina]|uniref:Encoded protein n=1 Tax=Dunaliella salina TaxID=3046 RepID=A0ABQ7GVV2_DUNSA|nr:hypothetical protein DUNSADRAFT_2288 [Dunaliella salina]|eukprot:KAF5838744.1 hypothetical protein DUNSADRAFT_2288 [Dunaliella salina]